MKYKWAVVKLVGAAVILAGAGILLGSGADPSALVGHTLERLRSLGAPAFFLCMALLPAAGAPISLFTLMAGPVFAPRFGIVIVLAMALAAITANMALSYLLAVRALRPQLEYLLKRFGYGLPKAAASDAADLIVLVRTAPGLPFAAQNYLLGLASIPFRPYLLISLLVVFPLNAAIIIFGDALLQGRGKAALIGLLLLLASMAAIQLLRRRQKARGGDPA